MLSSKKVTVKPKVEKKDALDASSTKSKSRDVFSRLSSPKSTPVNSSIKSNGTQLKNPARSAGKFN